MRCTTLTQLPRGILRRQHGELGTGRLRDARHRAVALGLGVGVDVDQHLLARPDAREFGLLEVGLDPEIAVGHHHHHRHAGGGVAAGHRALARRCRRSAIRWWCGGPAAALPRASPSSGARADGRRRGSWDRRPAPPRCVAGLPARPRCAGAPRRGPCAPLPAWRSRSTFFSASSAWRSKSAWAKVCWLSAALISSRLVRHWARRPRISARTVSVSASMRVSAWR